MSYLLNPDFQRGLADQVCADYARFREEGKSPAKAWTMASVAFGLAIERVMPGTPAPAREELIGTALNQAWARLGLQLLELC